MDAKSVYRYPKIGTSRKKNTELSHYFSKWKHLSYRRLRKFIVHFGDENPCKTYF